MEYGQTSKQPGGQGDENTSYFVPGEMFGEGDFYSENDEDNDDLSKYLADSDEEINHNNKNKNTTGMLSVSNAAGSSERSEIIASKRKYQRHTTYQIQQLEAVFRQYPYPEESLRIELSQRLGLDLKQIRFWFQNKRTQAKAQALHEQDARLKDENNKLRNENESLKTALISHTLCSNCRIPLPPISLNGNAMIVENAHLGEHLAHATFAGNNGAQPSPNPGLTSTRNYSSVPGATGTSSSTEAGAANINGSQILGFPESCSGNNMTSAMVQKHQSNIWIIQHAITATNELLRKADERDTSLWIKGLDGQRETLNYGEYLLTFPPILSITPRNFVCEATKATAVVQSPAHALVDAFMNSEAWTRMFSSLISTASTVEVICPGINGTKNGAVQLMQAEVQVISPMVPLCKLKFLRCCKQYAAGKWAVVDLSVDGLTGISTDAPYLPFRQLPSGCLIEKIPNGCCKVTWIAHNEYDEGMVAPIYRPMLIAGLGYGSAVWLTRLERHCKCMALFSPSAMAERGRGQQSRLSPTAQRGLLDVAQRMSDNFCYGVCGSKFQWMNNQTGNSENDYVYIKSRVSMDYPVEPSGIVLSAATSFWMPVARENLFEYLRKIHLINQWDLLSQGSQSQRVIYLNKGQDNDQNGVSVFRVTNMTTLETSAVIQDAWSDASGSLIVYAPTDISGIQAVMEGRDKFVAILPTGFVIYSDGKMSPPLGLVGNNITQNNLPAMGNIESGGSLLTIGFQVLGSSDPANEINEGSINVLNSLMAHTSNKIKAAMGCT